MENVFCLLSILLSPGNGEQRRAAGSEEIAEGCDDDNNRKAQPYSSQSRRSHFRDTGDIDSIHNVIEQA